MDGIGISIYKPIAERNAFRLLRLKASKEHDSPIECQLVPVTFDYTGDYSALSYTWGDAESSKEITLNGQPHLIRPNLHAVFLRLREKWDTDLWVDALCINQQDVPERNAQVTQMRYIYANAARVIVWLGESSNDADLA